MNTFTEMEWTAKWDWDNLMMFGSKVSGSPRKLQLTDWVGEDDEGIDAGSLDLSGVGSGSGHSGSDFGNGSSIKSSISASTDSSPKDGMRSSAFAFEALKGPIGDFSMKTEQVRAELSGSSPLLEASVNSFEPMIGLKLGKRTYFEDSCTVGNAKSPSSVIPAPSTSAAKKMRSPSLVSPITRCQVEGCNLDLSSAKEYHRKHRVCDSHSKSPKVIVGGLERRFCQQCSRFHGLSEFDEKKRSCRRRLSDHNARRRKPQQETIAFNSSRFSSSFYDGRQQMTFVMNPRVQTRSAAISDWESTHESKFTITRAHPAKSELLPGHQQMSRNQAPYAINMHNHTSNGLLALNGTSTPQAPSQGSKEPLTSVSVDAAQDFRRALSLLSTNSWGLCEPESIPLENPVHVGRFNMPQTPMHAVPQGLPLTSSEYWLNGQPSTCSSMHTLSPNNDGSEHYKGTQVFKTTYGSDFYNSPLED